MRNRNPKEFLPLSARFAQGHGPNARAAAAISKLPFSGEESDQFVVPDFKLTARHESANRILGASLSQQHGIPAHTYRPLAGALENNRGNSAVINPGATIPLIASTAMSAGQDAETIVATLGLSIANAPNETLILTESITVRAILEWGIGNAKFTAECDWLDGTAIQIPASFLRVGGRFEGTLARGNPQPVPIQLDVGFSYGSAGRRICPARYTQILGDAEQDGDNLLTRRMEPGVLYGPYQIPRFATNYIVTSMALAAAGFAPTAATPITIVQTANADIANLLPPGAVHTYVAESNLARQNEAEFPRVNGARYIYALNGGNKAAWVNAVWSLAL